MADERTITIEVDGRELQARAGEMLIQVTDAAGIPIPRFCYHKKLSVAANCRMCLVEVENVPKPLPACATPVNDGMKVYTRSPKAIAAQKGTMEFLLINHPLDCPICDQGGECELQDVAMGYGSDVSRYVEGKRVVPNPDLGPLVATDMTRCIHCTRCVRFGAEIAGIRELGATGRGEHMRIGTYVQHALDSELSGNIIDVCPVGALTSKPFRFRARAWELTQFDGIAPHDAVGSNIRYHVKNGRVMRVVPRDNEAVNETWLSDRDRFSYEGLYSEDRLGFPMVKDEQGGWNDVEWEEALEQAVKGLRNAMGTDPDQLGVLVSSNSTLEELYLAQKLARGLGSGNIDHRLRQGDFRFADEIAPFPGLNGEIAELESLDAALLVGSNPRKELPLLGHRLRKAAMNGARLTLLNPMEMPLNHAAEQIVSAPAEMVDTLAAVAKAAGASGEGLVAGLIEAATPGPEHQAAARSLKEAGKARVLLGGLATAHPDYSLLRALAAALAEATGATLGDLPAGANSVGAWYAGAQSGLLPGGRHDPTGGRDAGAMLSGGLKAALLLGIDPDRDPLDPAQAMAALRPAYVVALTAYSSPALEEVADVMLPMAPFAETSGTYVNAAGLWQESPGVVPPFGEARPAWKILRVLGNLFDLEGFDYEGPETVREEVVEECKGVEIPPPGKVSLQDAERRLGQPSKGLMRIGDLSLYASDAIVRRAAALQRTSEATAGFVEIHPAEAQRLGLAEGDEVRVTQGKGETLLPLRISTLVPEGCARVPAGVAGSTALGPAFGEIAVAKG